MARGPAQERIGGYIEGAILSLSADYQQFFLILRLNQKQWYRQQVTYGISSKKYL